MKRKISFAAAVLGPALLCGPLVLAQAGNSNPNPVDPSDVLGPQLIAWSHLQEPQPVTIPSEKPEAARDRQSAGASNQPTQIPSTQSIPVVSPSTSQRSSTSQVPAKTK